MTYVNEIEETQADPQLRGIYGNIEQNMGFLPHYFKALGTMPDAIEGQLKLGAAVMNDGALTKTEKEQIGVVVSGINSSSYCLVIHMELLQRLGVEKALARKTRKRLRKRGRAGQNESSFPIREQAGRASPSRLKRKR